MIVFSEPEKLGLVWFKKAFAVMSHTMRFTYLVAWQTFDTVLEQFFIKLLGIDIEIEKNFGTGNVAIDAKLNCLVERSLKVPMN